MPQLLTTLTPHRDRSTRPRKLQRLALALAISAMLAAPVARADEASLKAEIAELRAQIQQMRKR